MLSKGSRHLGARTPAAVAKKAKNKATPPKPKPTGPAVQKQLLVNTASKWQRKVAETVAGVEEISAEVAKVKEMAGFAETLALHQTALHGILKSISELMGDPGVTEESLCSVISNATRSVGSAQFDIARCKTVVKMNNAEAPSKAKAGAKSKGKAKAKPSSPAT